jgi:hypothetical protein
MFSLKGLKLVKNLKNNKLTKSGLLQFSASNSSNTELLDSIISNSSFVKEDLKIRAMVEDMLCKEFSKDIKNIKGYDFLVDSVVNKLKSQQLGDSADIEEDINNN